MCVISLSTEHVFASDTLLLLFFIFLLIYVCTWSFYNCMVFNYFIYMVFDHKCSGKRGRRICNSVYPNVVGVPWCQCIPGCSRSNLSAVFLSNILNCFHNDDKIVFLMDIYPNINDRVRHNKNETQINWIKKTKWERNLDLLFLHAIVNLN